MAKSTSKAGGKKAKVASRVLWKKQIDAPKGARAGAKTKAARPKSGGVASKKPAARPAAGPEAASAAVRDLAKRIVDLTVRGDDEGSFALYAPGVESQEMGVSPTVGIDALREKFAMWRAMAKESTWQAKNVWTLGNTIIIEWGGRVTLATGNTMDMREVAIHEVQNGKIVRERFYYDRTPFQPPAAEAQPAAPAPL